jgi:hypothetical protein
MEPIMEAYHDRDKFKKLSLREAARFDHDRGLKESITLWGHICRERQQRGISRKGRVLARQKALATTRGLSAP